MPEDNKDQSLDKELFGGKSIDDMPEEVQPFAKQLLGDYTRKTQDLAEKRKAIGQTQEQIDDLNQRIGELTNVNKQWQSWYDNWMQSTEDDNSDKQETRESVQDLVKDEELDADEKLQRLDQVYRDRIAGLESTIDEIKQQGAALGDKFSRMFNYREQLDEIMRMDEEVDKAELLKFAAEKGMTSLKSAYEEMYRPQIVEREVQKRLKEELEKQKTDGLKTRIRDHVVKTRPEDNSRPTFGRATESILRERAESGVLE